MIRRVIPPYFIFTVRTPLEIADAFPESGRRQTEAAGNSLECPLSDEAKIALQVIPDPVHADHRAFTGKRNDLYAFTTRKLVAVPLKLLYRLLGA